MREITMFELTILLTEETKDKLCSLMARDPDANNLFEELISVKYENAFGEKKTTTPISDLEYRTTLLKYIRRLKTKGIIMASFKRIGTSKIFGREGGVVYKRILNILVNEGKLEHFKHDTDIMQDCFRLIE